jgi:hypothetical protein
MEAFKIKNGLSAKRYLGSNGTETAETAYYSLSGASYDSVSFSVASQDANPFGMAFNDTGTKVYMVGNSSDTAYQYSLSVAYDLSTASYDSVSFSVASQTSIAYGLAFNTDGTKMFMLSGDNNVYQYSLSTGFNLSTASYDSVSLDISSNSDGSNNIIFKPDGTKMYVIAEVSDNITQYSLSTAYDLSTASYDSVSLDVSSQENAAQGASFNTDGTKMYLIGRTNDSVFQYSLTTPYSVGTASYDSISFSVVSQEATPRDIKFNGDGTKMYIIGNTSDSIYQYSTVAYTQTLDLSTGTTFSFTPSGATTVSFTNPPATGTAIGFSVEVNGDGSAITWPSSVKWHLATAPVALASKELYTFVTTDGGTTYYGKKAAEGLA